jgi:hypothetical protein
VYSGGNLPARPPSRSEVQIIETKPEIRLRNDISYKAAGSVITIGQKFDALDRYFGDDEQPSMFEGDFIQLYEASYELSQALYTTAKKLEESILERLKANDTTVGTSVE